jgi:hypothetical protein
MARFQPVVALSKSNVSRRRTRTWQILVSVALLFLVLTLMTMRYLPAIGIDPAAVLKSHDFQDMFVPPIPRPPAHWPDQYHNHSQHLIEEQSRLNQMIQQNKDRRLDGQVRHNNERVGVGAVLEPAAPETNDKTKAAASDATLFSVNKLNERFSQLPIDELQQIKSTELRREKVREVSSPHRVPLSARRRIVSPSHRLIVSSPRTEVAELEMIE